MKNEIKSMNHSLDSDSKLEERLSEELEERNEFADWTLCNDCNNNSHYRRC